MNKGILKKILWAGIEDYSGLWEIFWEVETIQKNNDYDVVKKVINETLQYLLDEGLINLFFCKEPYGKMTKIDENFQDVLANDNFWLPPSKNETSLRVGTTPKGEKYYQKLD